MSSAGRDFSRIQAILPFKTPSALPKFQSSCFVLQFSRGQLCSPELHGTRRPILIHLALKLGVAAAVSSSLVRSKEFKLLLFREERSFRQKIYLVLCMALAHHGWRVDSHFGQKFSCRAI